MECMYNLLSLLRLARLRSVVYSGIMGGALADKITELANRPVVEDYDVEDVFEHNERNSSDDDSSEDNEELRKAHYAPVERSKLRRDNVELDGKYRGERGSRASALAGEEVGDKMEDMADNEDESDAMSFRTDSEDEEDQISSAEEDSDSDREEESSNQGDEEDQHRRLATLVQAERKRAVNNLSESTKRDASKGFAILEQSKLFDNIIEVRMKLQNAVTNVNKLPVTQDSFGKSGSSSTKKTLKYTIELLNKVVGEIVNFRQDFQSKERISEDSLTKGPNKSKRSFEELTKETEELDNQLRSYRSTVLNKWSNKISAASGGSALKNNKFKAINQPADIQVENQLADLPRLLKRTRLNRRSVQPIRFEQDRVEGKLQNYDSNVNSNSNSGGVSGLDDTDELDIPKNYDPRRKTTVDLQENPYIFDDEDFYKILLNDLVDTKMKNAKVQGPGGQISISNRPNKLKKDVDTKASKGRKLNYSVQDAIAHYEVPRNRIIRWSDEQIDEFFAGLLGQKVNFDESPDYSEPVEDDEAIKKDDIQIFG